MQYIFYNFPTFHVWLRWTSMICLRQSHSYPKEIAHSTMCPLRCYSCHFLYLRFSHPDSQIKRKISTLHKKSLFTNQTGKLIERTFTASKTDKFFFLVQRIWTFNQGTRNMEPLTTPFCWPSKVDKKETKRTCAVSSTYAPLVSSFWIFLDHNSFLSDSISL